MDYAALRRWAADPAKTEMARRCAERLLALRQQLDPIRTCKSDRCLLLATWNIRDFDSNKFGYGPRLDEAFYYVAEIISAFDLIAVQEVNRDLAAFQKVMRILGREWDFVATDATEGAGGNNERMAFVYNTERVWFRRVAGEIVLPGGQLVVARKKVTKKPAASSIGAAEKAEIKTKFEEVGQQFSRSPFLVAFQSGWFKFSLCTVHIYYGADTGEKLDQRIEEIRRLVAFFAKRQDSETGAERDELGNVENYILLGDFNIVSPQHETMKALVDKGFVVPDAISGDRVRPPGHHFYDQIAVRVKDKRFKVTGGGLVDVFASVFRDADEDFEIYKGRMPQADPETNARSRAKTPRDLYRKWRTWQMSDHDPLWIAIDTDFTEHYLTAIGQ